MPELLSEHEKDLLAERIYAQAIGPTVHRMTQPGLTDPDLQQLFGNMQAVAQGALRAAEEWSRIRFEYRKSQETLREPEVEVKTDVLKHRPPGSVTPIGRKPTPT